MKDILKEVKAAEKYLRAMKKNSKANSSEDCDNVLSHMRKIKHQLEILSNQGTMPIFTKGEPVYSLRNKTFGTVKEIKVTETGSIGYVIQFGKNEYDYEFHYSGEVRKNQS